MTKHNKDWIDPPGKPVVSRRHAEYIAEHYRGDPDDQEAIRDECDFATGDDLDCFALDLLTDFVTRQLRRRTNNAA